jgi:Ca2+-binding RTX toxin-like protein
MRGIREGWTKHPWEWLLLLAALGLLVTLIAAPRAQGDNHLIKIRQVHPDNQGMFDAGDWVELQMFADGQNLVAGAFIRSYFSTGMLRASFQFPANANAVVANGQNQRTILVSNTSSVGGTTPDFNAPITGNGELQLVGQDGAVCYESPPPMGVVLDCVSYGAFTATGFATGSPATATPFGSTLERTIPRGCPTALDPADDTDNSAADFALSTRPPRNNAAAPTEVLCPTPTTAPAPTPLPSCAGKPATIAGTTENNTLAGTPQADVIAGLGGNDVIKGLAGNDTICGGTGKDRLLGGGGNDKLLGEAGKDTLKGGAGKDKLKGGAGKDVQVQ